MFVSIDCQHVLPLQGILVRHPTRVTLQSRSVHVYYVHAPVVQETVIQRMALATIVAQDLRVNTVSGVSLGWITLLIVSDAYLDYLD